MMVGAVVKDCWRFDEQSWWRKGHQAERETFWINKQFFPSHVHAHVVSQPAGWIAFTTCVAPVKFEWKEKTYHGTSLRKTWRPESKTSFPATMFTDVNSEKTKKAPLAPLWRCLRCLLTECSLVWWCCTISVGPWLCLACTSPQSSSLSHFQTWGKPKNANTKFYIFSRNKIF